ncbi:hypothetical protein [Nocardioides acrostichi]|uniref:Htaa protein n=1 Tax=Nocardioides acrostichi TaxID=2784339 RepID=A0A930UZT8_9ACTN|nr:hypothetical protein [Nocardioides acrostichi]MBF4161085.1 hypothetical protein [Nocardioides acrostichi]
MQRLIRSVTGAAVVLGLALALGAAASPPAAADQGAVVTVAGPGGASIDPTYATTLTVSGRGFQSIRGGHGGIYVFFGTVRAGWRPSQGGATGADYFYVPDSEAKDNAGYQRYVAFPGSDTAASANGGVISADGRWSTTLTVPGAVFTTVDRDGATRRVDCRQVTCGVITIGAHGVTNARNETFTPVRVRDLGAATASTPTAGSGTPSAAATPASEASTETSGQPSTSPAPARSERGPALLQVDRASARAGGVLSFRASGLPAGRQVVAVFDDGLSANGPFLVGDDGRLAGVVTLPATVRAGTHELRLYGLERAEPAVRFAVTSAEETELGTAAQRDTDRVSSVVGSAGVWFFVLSSLVLVAALLRAGLDWRRVRVARRA